MGFSHCLGIGPVRFNALLQVFGSAKKAYEADVGLIQSVIGEHIGKKFAEFRSNFDPIKKMEEIKKKNITVVTREDSSYPSQLKNISDAPICLYICGHVDEIDFGKEIFFGMVGTRKPTTYGTQVAQLFASELAAAGCIIVSGLALGVDAIAHKAAVDLQKKTIAFLGCGVDVIYPTSNTHLYHQIIKTGGLIMSEFPPGMYVQKGLFIARNRLISGLSRGVMVVEGLKDSGSLITAKYASEQGKEVFAPPVPLTTPNSEAPNLLLKAGAKLVTSSKDILDELNLRIIPKTHSEITAGLSKIEKEIYMLFLAEPKMPDDIAMISSLPIHDVLSTVSTLEIKGVLKKNQEGKYYII